MIHLAERKTLSKKLRFEVFKRDSFTCQYCGKSAPDVVLEVDHIIPVSKGGKNTITNLITSCFDCNRGKGNRKLTESQTVKAQKKELDKLNQRKEQIEMMAKWQIELIDIEKHEAEKIIEIVNKRYNLGISLSDNNIKEFAAIIKKYGFQETTESVLIAFEKFGDNTNFKNIKSICHTRKMDKDNPYLKDIYYIRGILRNRLSYINETECIDLLQQSIEAGAKINDLRLIAKKCRSYSEWKEILEEHTEG